MRVAYCSASDGPHDRRHLDAIRRLGHQVWHLEVRDGSVRSVGDGAEREFRYTGIPEVANESLEGAMRQAFSTIGPDIVHAGPVQTVGYPALRAATVPVVIMSWGSDILRPEMFNDPDGAIAAQVLRGANAFIADCDTVVQAATKLGLRAPAFQFPWGVDLDVFTPPSQSTVRSDKVVILSTRNWEPVYSVDTLARAFASAMLENPNLHLLLVGAGSQESIIRKSLAQATDRGGVEWLGKQRYADLPAIYRASDIYVSTSLSDGSSVSLLEAMASGRPALVSDIPSNREWVTDGHNGYLFQANNATALKEMLLKVGSHGPDALRRLGHQGRRTVEARADWSQNHVLLNEAYDAATNARNA